MWHYPEVQGIETIDLFLLALSVDRLDECFKKCKKDGMYIPSCDELWISETQMSETNEKSVKDLISMVEMRGAFAYDSHIITDILYHRNDSPDCSSFFKSMMLQMEKTYKMKEDIEFCDDIVDLLNLVDVASESKENLERFEKMGCSVSTIKKYINQLGLTQEDVVSYYKSHYEDFDNIESFHSSMKNFVLALPTTNQNIAE